MNPMPQAILLVLVTLLAAVAPISAGETPRAPNIVLIYADDLGWGDLGCYGATAVKTPHCDRLAAQGLRFTAGYCASGTCTPSRFALLTGEYPWRQKGTGILPGDAPLIIAPGRATLPALLKRAGYATAAIGKWHLGLGSTERPLDWNGDIAPGPLEIGFDRCFLIPATGDRTPCVYVRDHRVVGLDPADPLAVSYKEPFPGLPTGRSQRSELKMDWDYGHNEAVINGVGRIGYMRGGTAAQWKDEDMADTLAREASAFIAAQSKDKPFFLYFATHGIHVPRVVNPRFVGATGMGPRGDAIAEFDDQVGTVLAALERQGLSDNTLVLLSSDNGPVLNDGYQDQAVAKLGDHRPAGPFRGGKYSLFEAGTRVPFIARWPGRISAGTSDAPFCQIDLPTTLAALAGQAPAANECPDSLDMTATLLGTDRIGRAWVIEHANGTSIRAGRWKFIPATKSVKELLGTATIPQGGHLYDLDTDPGERTPIDNPAKVAELRSLMETLKEKRGTRTGFVP